MDKEYFIQLTNNLYRLTLLFPKKEPLRYKMREVADEILANLISILQGDFSQSKNSILDILKNLEILDSFFEIAKTQNWLSPFDILEVQREYSKIREEIDKLSKKENLPKSPSLRQQKILEILKEKGKVQIGEIISIFPELSRRTLIRDFEELCQIGLIERSGKGRGIIYTLKM